MLKVDAIHEIEKLLVEAQTFRGFIQNMKNQRDREMLLTEYEAFVGMLLGFAIAFKAPTKRMEPEKVAKPGDYIEHLQRQMTGSQQMLEIGNETPTQSIEATDEEAVREVSEQDS